MYKSLGTVAVNEYQDFYNIMGISYQEALLTMSPEQAEANYMAAKEVKEPSSWWGTLGSSLSTTTGNILKTTGQSWLEQKLGISKPKIIGQQYQSKSFLESYGLYLGIGAGAFVLIMMLTKGK